VGGENVNVASQVGKRLLLLAQAGGEKKPQQGKRHPRVCPAPGGRDDVAGRANRIRVKHGGEKESAQRGGARRPLRNRERNPLRAKPPPFAAADARD